MSISAIIVAAGSGQRAGGIEKQFQLLRGKPVIQWSAETFSQHPKIDRLVIVRPRGQREDLNWLSDVCDVVVEGGASRTESVLAGLSALNADDDEIVLIHDAARPGLSNAVIDLLIEALDKHDGAAPALAVADALKRRLPTQSIESVSREELFRVQTPQAFRLGKIRSALSGSAPLVDDLAAIEAQGGHISFVAGDIRLNKITYPEDFESVGKLMAPNAPAPHMRIGTGFDVHKFGPGDFVTLCGIEIPHEFGLVGHSDADVAWHALTDAILGAIAMGDIGDHFPPSDLKWKGAASDQFLLHAANLAREKGYEISNIDMTVICEAPKMKPHRAAMRQSTADLLGLSTDLVSLKATTTEALGFTGRREGLAAQAAVILTSTGTPT